MNDEQLLRYSRHILLPEIGIEGQEKIRGAHALIIGAGGLGSPVALYLASAGVGTLTICDDDAVDLTNLQRQIVHRNDAIGTPKAESARDTLASINPEVNVHAVCERVAGARLDALVAGSGRGARLQRQFRHAPRHQRAPASPSANRWCRARRCASTARSRCSTCAMRGSPCYQCLFPAGGDDSDMRCAVMGVFAPLVGIVGSMQAAEALKLICGAGSSLTGRLLLLDALTMEWRSLRLKRDAGCSVCAKR